MLTGSAAETIRLVLAVEASVAFVFTLQSVVLVAAQSRRSRPTELPRRWLLCLLAGAAIVFFTIAAYNFEVAYAVTWAQLVRMVGLAVYLAGAVALFAYERRRYFSERSSQAASSAGTTNSQR